MKSTSKHQYILPDGTVVNNQKEGCHHLKIGRNAFRNKVKAGVIKRIELTDKPKGYYETEKEN